ncbi:MAG: hypothetical protein BWY01_01724 [Synergistetes bacterium ADurb.Bin155]|nr:MAG: hypothetical protein BWY01_01724 [Synergistetes bacterium ADurb.Bin155]
MWTRREIPTAWRVVAILKRRARAQITDEGICWFVEIMTSPLALLVALAIMVILALISAPSCWR